MPSLRQLSAEFPALVLDAASSRVQVGCLQSDGRADWATSTAESGVAVFELLEQLRVAPDDMKSFIFCAGPGSILGIRTVGMAIRTWCVLRPRPVYSYLSLALVAEALPTADITVIADARRESWHAYRKSTGLKRVSAGELTGELATPEGFRHWTSLPETVKVVPYAVDHLLQATDSADLLVPTDSPDAFMHEEPAYVSWSPQIHRAPPKDKMRSRHNGH